MPDERSELSKAKISAFRFLKIRQRSVHELREKLTQKKFPKAIVEETIAFLLEKKFLDDRAFAKGWVRYRQARPYGAQKIRMELRQKGIDEDTIREELANAFGDYVEADVVLELARRRAVRYQGIDPVKRKKRIFDFLARRGFGLDAITKVLKVIASPEGAKQSPDDGIASSSRKRDSSPACHLPALAAPWCRPGAQPGQAQ